MVKLANYVIRGAEFAMETINFLMFIAQEANQVSIMAVREAMRQKKYKTAYNALHQYAVPTNAMVANLVFLYGIRMSPAWRAFYCYHYLTRVYISDLNFRLKEEIKSEIVKEGKDPNAVIDGKTYYETWLEKQD
jgi:hypothetical protein